MTEKTHDADLRAAKDCIKENVPLCKHMVKTRQRLEETLRQNAKMAEFAVVIGEGETDSALDGVGADALQV